MKAGCPAPFASPGEGVGPAKLDIVRPRGPTEIYGPSGNPTARRAGGLGWVNDLRPLLHTLIARAVELSRVCCTGLRLRYERVLIMINDASLKDQGESCHPQPRITIPAY